MISEWMKVMLEEISRKKAEAEQARVDDQTRADERTSVTEQTNVEQKRPRDESGGAPKSGAGVARETRAL